MTKAKAKKATKRPEVSSKPPGYAPLFQVKSADVRTDHLQRNAKGKRGASPTDYVACMESTASSG